VPLAPREVTEASLIHVARWALRPKPEASWAIRLSARESDEGYFKCETSSPDQTHLVHFNRFAVASAHNSFTSLRIGPLQKFLHTGRFYGPKPTKTSRF